MRQDSAGTSLKYSYYAKDGRLLWQRDEPASKRINNVYLAGSLLAEITRPIGSNAPTISYFHTDALGSPIAKTNAAGAIIETSEYEPYGRLLNRSNDNRAGYTGHVMDAVSGLTYMQQRYYDPGIGRFLSVDPVTALSNPVGQFNRYRYANNNPYRFKDPDGRKCSTADGKDSCTFDEFTNRKGDKITRQEALGGKISQLLGRGSRILRAEAGMTAKYTAAKSLAARGGEVTIKGNSALGIPDQKISGGAIVANMQTTLTISSPQSYGKNPNVVANVDPGVGGAPAPGPITYWKDGSAASDLAQVFGHEILHTLYSGVGVLDNGYANPKNDHQKQFDEAADEIH
ncbi:RHS repeat-associated core domain-containing protein [Thermomonas sp.]|uniref:RHS repeat-associated core domain-containing protein n=1 Tax=Thermomonas sp. TaxID=1971895 RepID=UPI00321F77CE